MARPLSTTIKDLVGRIVGVQMDTSGCKYPRFGVTLEQDWQHLRMSIENMRKKLGVARTDQLLDMCAQAKSHFDAAYAQGGGVNLNDPGFEDSKLGTRLMQDMEWIVRGREPFAYPKELYRWPLISGSRAAGDPDLDRDFAGEK